MVELWRDDMLEAMLEIDSQLKIKSAGTGLTCPLCRAEPEAPTLHVRKPAL